MTSPPNDFFHGKSKTYSERARSVTGSGPASTAIQAHTLVLDDSEQTTATESLRVGLAFDLQDVQWQENDLTDTDQTTSSGVHDGLAGLLSKGIVEFGAVVFGEVVTGERLATVLVYSLKDLE